MYVYILTYIHSFCLDLEYWFAAVLGDCGKFPFLREKSVLKEKKYQIKRKTTTIKMFLKISNACGFLVQHVYEAFIVSQL